MSGKTCALIFVLVVSAVLGLESNIHLSACCSSGFNGMTTNSCRCPDDEFCHQGGGNRSKLFVTYTWNGLDNRCMVYVDATWDCPGEATADLRAQGNVMQICSGGTGTACSGDYWQDNTTSGGTLFFISTCTNFTIELKLTQAAGCGSCPVNAVLRSQIVKCT